MDNISRVANRRRFQALILAALAGFSGQFQGLQAAYYPTAVTADEPLAYYPLNDPAGRSSLNVNVGSAGSSASATNINVHPFPGAIAGSPNRSQFFDTTAWSIIPWNAALNPDNTKPFTMEAWFYPASDQINGGQAAINNRYAYPGVNRQGWVIFQRAPDESYNGKPGFEGVGWNFRMFRANSSSAGLDVVSQVPYKIGEWTHMAVVYDPVDMVNPTLTMYINGVAAATNTWTGDGPGYVANTNDHPESEAPNGPAGLAFGAYNNTGLGSNPYFGAVDEFALYQKKLAPEQIQAHYVNGTNSARTTPYDELVKLDSPVAYLRMNELSSSPNTALNLGDLRASGNATKSASVRQSGTSPMAGDKNDGSASYHWRNNGGSTTTIPWLADNNPDAGTPFSFEAWFKPTSDRINPGAAAVANRYVKSGNRTGWVIFQRAPNESYNTQSGFEGVGWNFRMYTGSGSGGQNVTTSVPYKVGEWQHCVFTWTPGADTGAGNWSGTLVAYVNGAAVSTNDAAIYKANENPTEDGTDPSDLGIGAYNAASGLGSNPYEGDIDEVAIYKNLALTPDQVLAHYQAATNSHPATNYSTLVLTAGSDGEGTQRLMPATYLRFNDPAPFPVANAGKLGEAAEGSLVAISSLVAGPIPAAWVGFDADNTAAPFSDKNGWVSLNSPAGLAISGQITLEAWINPSAEQGATARIISHGPPSLSSYLDGSVAENAALLAGSEVYLGIKDGNYVVGSSDGTNSYSASVGVPVGDLGGGKWIHLAGTYDGIKWTLYRNGAQIATANASVGALSVPNGDWAIGAAGNGWADYFSGAIDEAAIYGKALSADRISVHYNTAASAGNSLSLSISKATGQALVTWTTGTLQQADKITGPFTDISGVASPYSPPAGATTKFYRLRE